MWRVVMRLAWRDLRRAGWRTAWIAAAVACSVAAVFGVRGAEVIARRSLETDLRRWLGADVSAMTGEAVDGEVLLAVDGMRPRPESWTLVSWTLAMSRSAESPDPLLTVVKVVDPATYPLYPGLVLEPGPLAAVLRDGEIAVSSEVLEKLHVGIGDGIEVGGRRLRIGGVVRAEADRLNGFAGVAARAIVSRETYRKAGLSGAGSAWKHGVLLKLSGEADLAGFRAALQGILPEAGITDYRESNQHAVSSVRANIAFLGVAAFLVMAVGGVGIVAAMRQHAIGQTPVIAVLKILGARTPHVAGVFLMEMGMLSVCGAAAGLPLGRLARDVALRLCGIEATQSMVEEGWLQAVWETLALMGLAFLPVLPQPAAIIRRVRPVEALRGWEGVGGPGLREKGNGVALGGAFVLLGLLGMRLVNSFLSAAALIGALLACFGLAVAMTHGALGMLAAAAERIRHGAMRLALRNLGNRAHGLQHLAVALAMGVMLMVTTYEANRAVGQKAMDALPFDGANLLVGGFEGEFRERVREALGSVPGVEGAAQVVTQARLRLSAVDGGGLGELQRGLRPNAIPEAWRDVGCLPSMGPDGVQVAADVADLLRVRVGSTLEFTSRSGVLRKRVAAVRPISRVEKFWYTFTLDCSGMGRSSLHHLAAARIRPQELNAARNAMAAQFPLLAVLTSGDLAAIGEEAAERILGITRIVAWYAIVASLAVLAAAVSASRTGRLREFAILSALGAGPGTVARIHSMELAAAGLLAAVVGSLLSSLFLSIALSVTLQRVEIAAGWHGAAAAMLLSPAVTVMAGWVPVYGFLRRRPLEWLRMQ
ncbi:MAG: hypothetical protein JNK48_04580 [Bryobacterales bacterium]|nr:hypothetical protein [Bryobacterales bacterium]